MSELTKITRAQLALRNGQDKPEIWIAKKGLVYDVTNSRFCEKESIMNTGLGKT